MEKRLRQAGQVDAALYLQAKKLGFLDRTIESLSGQSVAAVRRPPVYKTVDTCAAEFDAETPYYYSTYDEESEVKPAPKEKGAGAGLRPHPHRPGDRV